MLSAWELLNVQRAWNWSKALLQQGEEISALGIFMKILAILQDRFTEAGSTRRISSQNAVRPGYAFIESVPTLYAQAALALEHMVELSPDNAMSVASVRFVLGMKISLSWDKPWHPVLWCSYPTLQACEWILSLLLEAHNRPGDQTKNDSLVAMTSGVLCTLFCCHKARGNIAAAYVLVRQMNINCSWLGLAER